MSQKDQEAAIDERIERIRRRNEEIQRRYLEVEADKLNAEKLNAAVKFTPSPPKNPEPERKNYSRPEPINRNPRFERKVPDKPYVPKHQVHGKKTSFADNDGPPPDPVYTFLSDSSRDAPRFDHSPDEKATKENFSGGEFRGSRGGGRGRGWSRGRGSPGRGGKRGVGNHPSGQSPQMQPDYQAWRAEREKIDQDRITRQKTAEGNWRREWDMKKLSQDENQEFHSRPAFSKKKRRDGDELKIQRTVVNELASPSVKEQEGKGSEKSSLAKSSSKGSPGEKKTVVFKVDEGPSFENDEIESQESSFEHRNIISFGDSIKISLSNKPIKSVKVNPMNLAGTGRVGPRQKPRLSYSSQSEDEKEIIAPILRKRSHVNQSKPSISEQVDASKKPPLPPRGNTSSPKKQVTMKSSHTNKESENQTSERKELSRESSHENISDTGDDSWEDMATTSGNESAEFSDADVTKKSNNEDECAEKELKKDDKSEMKDDAVNKLNKASAEDLSEMVDTQSSFVEKETVLDKDSVLQEENEEETCEQEDKTTENEEGSDNKVLSNIEEVKEVSKEKESKEEELCEEKEVKTAEGDEQKSQEVFSGKEVLQERISPCADKNDDENTKGSTDIQENVNTGGISVKDVSKGKIVMEETHSPDKGLHEEEKDQLEHQNSNVDKAVLGENDSETNSTEKDGILKEHENIFLPKTENANNEIFLTKDSEEKDNLQVSTENDLQSITKLEEA